MSSRFDRDTAVSVLPDGTVEATMSGGWWIERGPNGGYVAAVILRALYTAVLGPLVYVAFRALGAPDFLAHGQAAAQPRS